MNEFGNDLVKSIDRLFDEHCPRVVRESAEAGQWPHELWQALEELGLPRAMLAEEAGGSALDFAHAMLVLRRCAYHAAPLPLAETLLAGRLLSAAGLSVPQGALTVAPVVEGDSLVVAQGSGGQLTLSGVAHRVPWGDACAWAAVVALQDGLPVVALVSTESSRGHTERNLAGEARTEVRFDAAPVEACAPLADARAWLLNEGALYRSVQLTGALERILELSLQYANERVQFGRAIGKFQAVQHMLALLAGQVAASSAAVDAAIEASADRADELAVSICKARAGEAAGKGSEIAHQVHGAMGFTREHGLHYSTRRLWTWREEFGCESFWQIRLGRLVAARGADALWPMLTAL